MRYLFINMYIFMSSVISSREKKN